MPASDRNLKIGVIGSGVIGLSTALALKQQFSSVLLDVISDKDYVETTSYGPPGIFRPHKTHGPEFKWAQTSFKRYLDLWCSSECYASGVQLISGHVLGEQNDLDWCKSMLTGLERDFKWLEGDDFDMFPKKYKHGFHCTAFTTEGREYGPWLIEKLKSGNVQFLKKHVSSINQISPDYDYIINCSGLAARELVQDNELQPQRGVLIQVDAPWMKNFLFADRAMTYIIPGRKTVYLGGLRQDGNPNLTINDMDRDEIMTRVGNLVPGLKKAPRVREWCGLRPKRNQVRLELDTSSRYNLPVIHNYGHSGNGFVLSWGCAQNVVQLMLKTMDFTSKL